MSTHTTRIVPPYDRQLEVVRALANFHPVIDRDMIAGIRDRQKRQSAMFTYLERDIRRVDVTVEGETGPITVTVFSPKGAAKHIGVLHIHGGGTFSGDRFNSIATALGWVSEFGVTCVTAEYRLAPEHPYPAAFNDCAAVLTWMVSGPAELDIDDRPIVEGVSSGGGLAAALCLFSRDTPGLPQIRGQVLLAPMLDDRNHHSSSLQFESEGPWSARSNSMAWNAYLEGIPSGQFTPTYAAPGRCENLSDLPPAYIDVGTSEVFRDEAVAYAPRLWAAGNPAALHVWPGAYHCFD